MSFERILMGNDNPRYYINEQKNNILQQGNYDVYY